MDNRKISEIAWCPSSSCVNSPFTVTTKPNVINHIHKAEQMLYRTLNSMQNPCFWNKKENLNSFLSKPTWSRALKFPVNRLLVGLYQDFSIMHDSTSKLSPAQVSLGLTSNTHAMVVTDYIEMNWSNNKHLGFNDFIYYWIIPFLYTLLYTIYCLIQICLEVRCSFCIFWYKWGALLGLYWTFYSFRNIKETCSHFWHPLALLMSVEMVFKCGQILYSPIYSNLHLNGFILEA